MTKRRTLLALIFAALLVLSLVASFFTMRELESVYAGISLRFDKELSPESAQDLRRDLVKAEENRWVTFWSERKLLVEGERKSSKAMCSIVSGEPARASYVKFTAGGYPSELDEGSCAISQSLSHAIFGSEDTLGLTVKIDGEPYKICGIYEGEEPSAVFVDDSASFQNVELYGADGEEVTTEVAMEIAGKLGGEPKDMIDGYGMRSVLKLLLVAELALPIIGLVVIFLMRQSGNARRILLFTVLLLLAVSLPLILSQLPTWIIPTRWSDFDFWTSLADTFKSNLRAWFLLVPLQKDALGKLLLAQRLLLSAGAIFSSTLLLVALRPLAKARKI